MPSSSQVIYQPYIAGALGAQVVRVTHDDDAGEFGEPEFLGKLGRVPETD